MKDNTFIRSIRLVPEIYKPFLWSSLIAVAGTIIRMVGPQLISRGIDNGVVVNDYEYLLQQCLYYFCLLYTSPSPRDVEESRMPSSA